MSIEAPALLAVIRDGRWYPGIGDPTVGGWLAVGVYGIAAFACLRCARRGRAAGARVPPSERRFWIVATATLVFLGINKQLDIQGLVTQIARETAQANGWYDRRGPVQVFAVIAFVTIGLAATAAIGWRMRRSLADLWLAFVGAAMLVLFISARLGSFHRVDVLLAEGAVPLKWVLEIGGAAAIGANALWRAFRLRDLGPRRREPLGDPGRHASKSFLRERS